MLRLGTPAEWGRRRRPKTVDQLADARELGHRAVPVAGPGLLDAAAAADGGVHRGGRAQHDPLGLDGGCGCCCGRWCWSRSCSGRCGRAATPPNPEWYRMVIDGFGFHRLHLFVARIVIWLWSTEPDAHRARVALLRDVRDRPVAARLRPRPGRRGCGSTATVGSGRNRSVRRDRPGRAGQPGCLTGRVDIGRSRPRSGGWPASPTASTSYADRRVRADALQAAGRQLRPMVPVHRDAGDGRAAGLAAHPLRRAAGPRGADAHPGTGGRRRAQAPGTRRERLAQRPNVRPDIGGPEAGFSCATR
ncbi:hypothetical protein HBB16_21615 [Pseudonocardia sp. MCCB 268]|nr:hypothetical protein [Pseudonocardia cytotoxica]